MEAPEQGTTYFWTWKSIVLLTSSPTLSIKRLLSSYRALWCVTVSSICHCWLCCLEGEREMNWGSGEKQPGSGHQTGRYLPYQRQCRACTLPMSLRRPWEVSTSGEWASLVLPSQALNGFHSVPWPYHVSGTSSPPNPNPAFVLSCSTKFKRKWIFSKWNASQVCASSLSRDRGSLCPSTFSIRAAKMIFKPGVMSNHLQCQLRRCRGESSGLSLVWLWWCLQRGQQLKVGLAQAEQKLKKEAHGYSFSLFPYVCHKVGSLPPLCPSTKRFLPAMGAVEPADHRLNSNHEPK